MSATFLSPNAMNDDIPLPVMRAAEARANGLSMTAAATTGGWTIDGLRRWINRHSAVWYRVLKRARCDARDAACDEAVAYLRKHLRADEDKTSLQAAGGTAAERCVSVACFTALRLHNETCTYRERSIGLGHNRLTGQEEIAACGNSWLLPFTSLNRSVQ